MARVVVAGQRTFAAAVLQAVVEAGAEVAGVVCPSSDKSLGGLAEELGIPRLALSLRTGQWPLGAGGGASPAWARGLPGLEPGPAQPAAGAWWPEDELGPNPDALLCAHLHDFVGAETRGLFRLGAIGYHPSLLPRHRGRDSIEWAIRFGDPITGGTLLQYDDGADTGPIVAQCPVHIRPGDDASSLWRRELFPLGVEMFRGLIGKIDRGAVRPRPQDEAVATWEPAIEPRKLREVG